MPNHVITEVVIRNVDRAEQEIILASVRGADREIDFGVLLPIPLNVWCGSVGTKHKVFPDNALDWCAKNWSTKWNAYGLGEGGRYQSIVQTDDTLTLTFRTAWRAPLGWLLALWHKTGKPLEYTWLDEGRDAARVGHLTTYDGPFTAEPWVENVADETVTRRMHKLMWGVEEFTDEDNE